MEAFGVILRTAEMNPTEAVQTHGWMGANVPDDPDSGNHGGVGGVRGVFPTRITTLNPYNLPSRELPSTPLSPVWWLVGIPAKANTDSGRERERHSGPRRRRTVLLRSSWPSVVIQNRP